MCNLSCFCVRISTEFPDGEEQVPADHEVVCRVHRGHEDLHHLLHCLLLVQHPVLQLQQQLSLAVLLRQEPGGSSLLHSFRYQIHRERPHGHCHCLLVGFKQNLQTLGQDLDILLKAAGGKRKCACKIAAVVFSFVLSIFNFLLQKDERNHFLTAVLMSVPKIQS